MKGKSIYFKTPEIQPKLSDAKIYRNMSKIYSTELVNISKPCYYPKLSRYKLDIQKEFGITNEEILLFKSNIIDKYKNFKIYGDKYTITILIIILYYQRQKKFENAKIFFDFLALKFYDSLAHILFPKYCNSEAWILALNNVSHRHLFKVKNGIPSAIRYISSLEYEKNKQNLMDPNLTDETMVKIINMLRTRIAQSLKSFAETYYKAIKDMGRSKGGDGIESTKEIDIISDKYSTLICTYKQIDKNALSKAVKQSGIQKNIAEDIIKSLSNVKNRESLRYLIVLLYRMMDNDVKFICMEKNRRLMIRRILGNELLPNKETVKSKILELLYSLDIGHKIKTVYNVQLVSFFSHYITMFLQNRIC